MAALAARSPLPYENTIRSSSRNFSVSPALSDSQSQLDDIITDLLSDKALMKDSGEFDPVQLNGVVMPQHGCITTQSGNSRTVLSWQTHQAGPTKSISVSSQSISRPSPNTRVESDSKRQHSHSVQRLPAGSSSLTDEERWAASERYHYSSVSESKTSELNSESNKRSKIFSTAPLTKSITEPVSTSPPPPPVRRRMFSPDQLSNSEYNDASYRSPPNRGGRNISTSYKRSISETRPCASDSEDALGTSWLDTQRAKLQDMRTSERQDTQQRVTKSYRSYQTVQSDTEDNRVTGGYGRGGRHGGEPPARPPPPVCSYDSLDELNTLLSETSRELTLTREHQQHQQQQQLKQQRQVHPRSSSVGAMRHNNYETQPCFFVSGIERPAYSKQQTKYVFSVSPSPSSMLRDDTLEESWTKPPTCTSPQAPRRGDSSKQAVQRRNNDGAPTVSVDELDQTLAKLLATENPRNEWMTEKIIEEEIISLEPIGRGIQTLEPDTSTLPKVRSRAVSPVYPGFPVPGYRSPSLGRMMEPVSPLPGFKTPTPAPAAQIVPTAPVAPLPSASFPTYPSTTLTSGTSGRKSAGILSKEEDLEEAINAMMADAMPYNTSSTAQKEGKSTVIATKQESSTMKQEKQTYQHAQQTPQLQPSGGQQPGVIRETTVTKTTSVIDRGPSPAFLDAQQQVLKQQQLLLQQSQQIQQLRQQQEQLRQQQAKLDQQTHAAQQLQQLHEQQQQQQQPGWIVQEQTIERTLTRGSQPSVAQSGMTTTQQKQTQFQQNTDETEDIQQLLNSLTEQHQHHQQSGQKIQTETERIYSVSSKAPSSAGYSSHSTTATSGSGVIAQQNAGFQQNAICKHGMQYGGSSSEQTQHSCTQESVTAQQRPQQQQGWKVETAVVKTAESTATQAAVPQASYSTQSASSSSAFQRQNVSGQQQNFAEESKEYSTVTQHQQRQQAVMSSARDLNKKSGSETGSLTNAHSGITNAHYGVTNAHSGVTNAAILSGSQTGVSSEMSHHEQYQEQHYATIPVQEHRQNALNVQSTETSATVTERATSPSHWTSDTLRSYTARMHSGSASPLFQPGSTLPQHGRAASPGMYFGHSRSGSVSSMNEGDTTTLRFVKDTSRFWHRPNISREEAIHILRDKPPGSFIVRNSSTFQGAYGLALKVAQIPPNVQSKGGDPQTELVRHFLIEPTAKGVRLKGCSNEPVFGSLAALVYQHTLTPLALPCKLLLPEDTEVKFVDETDGKTNVLSHGAACNVLYVNSVDTESLTGPAALSKAMQKTFGNNRQPKTALVQFKVTTQGITLTDHKRSIFFRRHYPMNTITYCGIDEGERRWQPNQDDTVSVGGRVFGFVGRKPGSLSDNACHLFVESDPGQPATAIVDYITKIMIGQGQFMKT